MDIERRAAGPLARRPQREDFGVRHAGLLVPAGADGRAVPDDDAAHARIRSGRRQAALGERERLPHEFAVGGAEHHLPPLRARFSGFLTSRIASWKSSTRWKSSYTEAKRMYATSSIFFSSRITISPITRLAS